MSGERDFSAILNHNCKRKDARKTKKKLKVACRVAFSQHKKLETAIFEKFSKKISKKQKRKLQRQRRKERKEKEAEESDGNCSDLEKFKKEAEEARLKLMQGSLEDDEMDIKIYEKKLGLTKENKNGKKKKITDELDLLMDEESENDDEEQEEDKDQGDQVLSDDDTNIQQGAEEEDLSDVLDEVEDFDMSVDEDQNEDSGNEVETSSCEQDDTMDGEKSGGKETKSNSSEDIHKKALMGFNSNLLNLAKRAKMNSYLKSRIFCIVMSAEGQLDAFEKLKELALNGPDERELVNVCLRCSMLESDYNPYYAQIINSLCIFRKRFQVTTQYAIWDQIKTIETLKEAQKINFANTTSDLIKSQAIGISVLRIINFDEINKAIKILLQRILYRLLTNSAEFQLRDIFLRAIECRKDRRFSEGLQLFLGGEFEREIFKNCPTDRTSLFKKRLIFTKNLWSSVIV